MDSLDTAAARPLTDPQPRARWRSALGRRLVSHLPLKIVGVSGVTWVFFLGYFELLRHPAGAAVVMPLTAVDQWVPAQPAMLAAYLSLWFYIGVGPGIELKLRELVVYGLWVGALCLTGLALFWAWPTQVPPAWRAELAAHPLFAMLQGVDAAGNACPSMHVAAAVFTAIRVDDTLRRTGVPAALRRFNALWCLAIAYSTVAVRQHVALDALAGALLGAAFAWPSMRWRPRPAQP